MLPDERETLSDVPDSGMGWFAATIEATLRVTYMDHRLTHSSAAALVDNLEVDIVTWPPGKQRVVLYEAPSPVQGGPALRRDVAAVLERHKDKICEVVQGYCLVTPSAIVRGLLTATFWLAPPGYPTHVSFSAAEGLAWLGRCVGRGDTTDWLEEYDTLKQDHREKVAFSSSAEQQA